MQKLLACVFTVSALAALCGCATAPSAEQADARVEKEYVTGSMLSQARTRAPMTDAEREEARHQAEARTIVPSKSK